MITVPSQNPVTLTQNGVSVVYDKWAAPHVQLVNNGDGFTLRMTFYRYAEVDGGALVQAPVPGAMLTISDVLTDEVLAPLAGEFFTAVVTKAFAQGVLD